MLEDILRAGLDHPLLSFGVISVCYWVLLSYFTGETRKVWLPTYLVGLRRSERDAVAAYSNIGIPGTYPLHLQCYTLRIERAEDSLNRFQESK